MTATLPHRNAGGDRRNEQEDARPRWFGLGGRLTTLLLIPAVWASFLVAGVLAPQANAATTTTATTTTATTEVSFTATDATFVVQTDPKANKNSLDYLVATSSAYRTFLKFNTASLGTKKITGARLELAVMKIGVKQSGLVAYPATNSWSAASLTWNTRPAADGRALNTAVLPVAGKVAMVPLKDVSTISKTGATSFQIGYNVASADFWMAKGDTAAPRLVVTVENPTAAATPTPAAAIVGAGTGPVDIPAVSTHKKLVFAHYFTPYPISIDNKPAVSDYYTNNYLNPAGENGKFATSGGLLRDRPLPSTPVTGDWKSENQKTEVRQAIAAGIDGFSIDILNLTGGNWTSILSMMDAAHAVSPTFKIMLMPDMTSATGGYDQAALAGKMAILAAYPAAYRISTGALVVAPFKGEAQTPAWWTTFRTTFISTMNSSHGIKVAFLPVFLSTGPNIPKYASISYGLSSWGVRNPKSILAAPDYAAQAHALGKKWMAPIAIQDSRPNQFVYAESANTETLRASWTRAIDDGADFTQLITWNDYSEMTSFAPSVNHGHSYLDINAYYQTQFQTGSTPAIAREAVFVTHRTQVYDSATTYQNKQMVWWNGGTTPRDTVEVLTFLKSPATVTATVGSSVQTYTAPAGVSATLFPLVAGTVKATAVRASTTIGTATSPFTVAKTPYVQDEEYFAVSSLRPNTK